MRIQCTHFQLICYEINITFKHVPQKWCNCCRVCLPSSVLPDFGARQNLLTLAARVASPDYQATVEKKSSFQDYLVSASTFVYCFRGYMGLFLECVADNTP